MKKKKKKKKRTGNGEREKKKIQEGGLAKVEIRGGRVGQRGAKEIYS
jgi:hypothetical protein